MGTFTSSPDSKVTLRSTSGCVFLICSLNALESLANKKLSTKFLISFVSSLPFTEVIMYFNLVESSGEEFLFIFFNPANSLSTFFSSAPVNIL